MKIISNILLFYVVVSITAVSTFFVWRTWPVRIHVAEIIRVEKKFLPFHERVVCNAFQVNQRQFEEFFANSHRLFQLEVHDTGYGSCFYKAEIDGVEYKIWAGGIAEVRDGASVRFYAADAAWGGRVE